MTRSAVAMIAAALLATQTQAAFHLWNIREIYSDGSGSLQYIELFTSDFSQQFVGGQQIVSRNSGNTLQNTFTIPSNLPGDSANHAFLLGTAGLQAAGGPSPDFIIPNNFLFAAGGTITFFGANSGSYSALPTDGVLSRTWGDGNAVNSPQNFAGQVGFVAVPEPAVLTLFGTVGVGICLLRRRST